MTVTKRDNFKQKIALKKCKLSYQLSSFYLNIDTPFISSFFFLCFSLVASAVVFALDKIIGITDKLGIVPIVIIVICLITFLFLFVAYKIGLMSLSPDKRAELETQRLSSEKIIKKLIKELDQYMSFTCEFINENNPFEEIPAWFFKYGRYCHALIQVASKLLECEKESLINLFLVGIEIPYIERDLREWKKNKKWLSEFPGKREVAQEIYEDLADIDKHGHLEEEEQRHNDYVEKIVKSFEKIRDRINKVKDDPQLVNLGISEIIKEPSTGKSCKNYMKRLHEIKSKTSKVDLLNILAASRKGISIKNLLLDEDILKNLQEIEKINYLHYFNQLNDHDIKEICNNFETYHNNLCPVQGAGPHNILTLGYSNVVRRVIEHCEKNCARDIKIYIIRSCGERGFFLREEDLMEQELRKSPKIQDRICVMELENFLENDYQDQIDIILLGAENIKTNGIVLHPRGRKKIIKEIKKRRNDIKTIICAESYKVKNMEDSPWLTRYNLIDYDYFVSSANVYEVQHQKSSSSLFKKLSNNELCDNLTDCIAKWKNLINTSLRKKVEKG